MKLPDKIFLMTLPIALGLAIISSCQAKPENKESVENSDQIISTSAPPGRVDTTKILKEKVLIDFIATAKTIKPNSKNGVPFDKLDYDKVIAYDFAGSEEPYPGVIDEKGKFVPVVLGQQFLAQDQANKILSTLASKSTYGEATAACFQPHFAIVFYKENIKVNQINICLDCNYLISEIPIPAETHKKINVGTKEEYALTGFTNSGKKAIIDLCKELNFYYGGTESKSN